MSDYTDDPNGSSLYSETETVSWLSRIKDALVGLVFGLIIFIGTVVGLFWNEGRAVTTTRSLHEGAGVMVAADASHINPANSGKFVHVTGDLKASAPLVDDTFGVSASAVRMDRIVEMYQWDEDQDTETTSHAGGSQTKTTRYRYERKWSSTRIDSSRFKHSANHSNPPMRFQSKALTDENASLGAFQPGRTALEKLRATAPLEVSSQLVTELKRRHAGDVQINDGRIYFGADPSTPRIGDIRITYKIMAPGPASFIGSQSGTALIPFATESGDRLLLVQSGIMTADQMFKSAHADNALLTWIVRAVCTLLMWLGLYLLLRPFVVLGDVVPLIGSILGAGGAIVALIATLVVAPFTIAAAWFWYRPLLSVAIVCVGLALAYWARNQGATPGHTPPPNPPRGLQPPAKPSFLSQRMAQVRQPMAASRGVSTPRPSVSRPRGNIVQPPRQTFGTR
jgi:hypothetical protein